MSSIPKTSPSLRSRIDRNRKALQLEWRTFRCIDDSGGVRFVLFWLHFLLDDAKASRSYLRWFAKHFPDDGGEPFAQLCRTLMLRRLGDEPGARVMLADVMFGNLYLLPVVLEEVPIAHDIWHSNSWCRLEYAAALPTEIRAAITSDEREWLRTQFESLAFRRARQRHVELYRQLQDAPVGKRRSAIVERASQLQDELREELV